MPNPNVPEETPGQPDEVLVEDQETEPVGPVEDNPDLPPDGC